MVEYYGYNIVIKVKEREWFERRWWIVVLRYGYKDGLGFG